MPMDQSMQPGGGGQQNPLMAMLMTLLGGQGQQGMQGEQHRMNPQLHQLFQQLFDSVQGQHGPGMGKMPGAPAMGGGNAMPVAPQPFQMPLQPPVGKPNPGSPDGNAFMRSAMPIARQPGTINQQTAGPAGQAGGPLGTPFGMYGAMYGGRGK